MLKGQNEYSSPEAQARLAYGIITGIGFIGGGAILKNNDGNLSGTATAASIWSTGTTGMEAAHGRYEIAMALSFMNFVMLWVGHWLKPRMGQENFFEKPQD